MSTLCIVDDKVYMAICLISKVLHVIKSLIYYQVQKNLNAHILCPTLYVRKHEMVISCMRCKLYVIIVQLPSIVKKILIPFILLYFHATGREIYEMSLESIKSKNREMLWGEKAKALSRSLWKYKARIMVQQKVTAAKYTGCEFWVRDWTFLD